MTVVVCALWGLVGSFAVEGLEIAARMRRTGQWPWKPRKNAGPFVAAVVIRFGVGAALAAAVGASGPMSALAAFMTGVAAPLIIEKIAQQIPVTEPTAAPISQSDHLERSATTARSQGASQDQSEVIDAT